MCVCLRASTPVVEDDQDIGESNASVTINIGGAGVLFSFFNAKGGHAKSDVINVVIAIAVDITIHIGIHSSASAEKPGSVLLGSSGQLSATVLPSRPHRCQCLRSRIHNLRDRSCWDRRDSCLPVLQHFSTPSASEALQPRSPGLVLVGSVGHPSLQSATPSLSLSQGSNSNHQARKGSSGHPSSRMYTIAIGVQASQPDPNVKVPWNS